jgi:type 1 glutamine amidotransferase
LQPEAESVLGAALAPFHSIIFAIVMNNRISRTFRPLAFKRRCFFSLAAAAVLALNTILAAVALGADSEPKPAKALQPKVLVFSRTLGFRHSNIPLGVSVIRQLGEKNGFAVDATEESGVFTPVNLNGYRALVFLSVTGDVLDPEQENALKDYVMKGGGFVGVHGALFGPSACEEKWEWYHDLCCVSFRNHSAVVSAIVDIEDPRHPSTLDLPLRWTRTDEWYNYDGTPRGRAHVLATVEESSYKGGTVGDDHPIAWCKAMGKGLVWYTAMGHTEESFTEPLFLKHLLGGIQFAAGMKKGDCAPNITPRVSPAPAKALKTQHSAD